MMAIKNTSLGGTDWGDELLTSYDLNDTFDAAASKVLSLSAFWLNSDLYDVYDDFNSYSVGAFTSNSNWTITASAGQASATIVNSQIAGGTTDELRLTALAVDGGTAANITAEAIDLGDDKHVFTRMAVVHTFSGGAEDDTSTVQVSINGGSNYYTFYTGAIRDDSSITVYTNLLVVALGSDDYDVYVGGKRLAASVNTASLNVVFRVNGVSSGSTNTINLYVDDVRQAKSVIS